MNERKFSGSDAPINATQMYWTALNIMIDDGVNVSPEDIDTYDDYYIYALSKHTTIENMAYRFDTTVDIIQERIQRAIETEVQLKAIISQRMEQTKNGRQ